MNVEKHGLEVKTELLLCSSSLIMDYILACGEEIALDGLDGESVLNVFRWSFVARLHGRKNRHVN